MPRKKGYQRARLLRGKEPGSGREAAPDGLDRSDPDGLAPLADAFLLAQEVKNYSDRTLDTRRYALTIFLQWAQDRELKRPETITKPILESYQRHLWNYRKKDGKPLSVGTQIGRLTAIRQLFKWLCKENHLPADPAAHLEMPKEERRLPEDTLSEAEVAAVLNVPNIADPLGVRDRAHFGTVLLHCLAPERVGPARAARPQPRSQDLVRPPREGRQGSSRARGQTSARMDHALPPRGAAAPPDRHGRASLVFDRIRTRVQS